MEEILASIRRIIADDDIPKVPQANVAPTPRAAMPAAPAPVAEPEPIFQELPVEATDKHFEPIIEQPVGATQEDAADILELTDDMRSPEPPLSAFRTIDGQPDIMFAEPAFEPAPQPSMRVAAEPPVVMSDHLESARRALAEQMDQPLLSTSASTAVDTAFASLAHTVLSQNARTLDDLVKDMLRPMLKSWLDDNLPSLVERLVRAEIERVSRGR